MNKEKWEVKDHKINVEEVPASEWMKKTKYKVLASIIDYCIANLHAPSVEDLQELTGLKSKCSINRHIKTLRDEGLLTYQDFKPRTIKLTGYKLIRAGIPVCEFCGEELEFNNEKIKGDKIQRFYNCPKCKCVARFEIKGKHE